MKIFISAVSQFDNLGDLEIRRLMVEWLSPLGVPQVLADGVPASFVDGLALPPDAVTYDSSARWLGALVGDRRTRRALVYAPGEQPMVRGRHELRQAVVSLLVCGPLRPPLVTVKLGRSFGGADPLMVGLERRLKRHLDLLLLRDGESAELLGGASLMPDIALGTALPAAAGRARGAMAASFRFDLPGTARLARPVLGMLAREREPLLVTQVGRDRTLNADLAARLGADHVDWRGQPHLVQRSRVFDAYSRADVVVSNRFHALVFGMVSGAVPIALVEGPGKLTRLFALLGLEDFCAHPADHARIAEIATDPALRFVLLTALATATDRLREVRAGLGLLLAPARSPVPPPAGAAGR